MHPWINITLDMIWTDEDLELFEDLPDLVLSTNSSTDDDAQLTLSHKEIESLQDIYITDVSSENSVLGTTLYAVQLMSNLPFLCQSKIAEHFEIILGPY